MRGRTTRNSDQQDTRVGGRRDMLLDGVLATEAERERERNAGGGDGAGLDDDQSGRLATGK